MNKNGLPEYEDFILTFSEYQKAARYTAIYPSAAEIIYPALGLAGEAGEVANKVKKMIRDNKLDRAGVASELGDCMWYIASLATDLGLDLDDIAHDNLLKLYNRKINNTIQGSGDER